MIERLRAIIFTKGVGLVIMLTVVSLVFIDGMFWIYEDINKLPHVKMWYDMLSFMVHLIALSFVLYLDSDGKYQWGSYKHMKELISDDTIVIFKKENKC